MRRFSKARSRALAAWIDRMRGGLQPPKGVDPVVTNALVLLAAIQQLVLSSVTSGRFANVSLDSEKDWDKVKSALKRLVDRVP